MRLHLQGVVGSGVELLDDGIRDIAIHVSERGVHVYTTTGRNGGLVGYRIDDGGEVTVQTTVIFPPNLTSLVSERIVLGDHGSGPVLFVGASGQGLIGYGIGTGGGLSGSQQLGWSDAVHSASNGGRGIVEAWVTHTDNALNLFPADYAQNQIVSLTHVTINGREYVLAADADNHAVTSFRRDPATGQLTEVESMGMLHGLGIHAPTAMEVVQIGGQTFVVLAASGTSSLSVMQLGTDGSLTPTDHLIDTGTTRFAGVQAMTTARSGDHVFVIAGGADHGLTVFLMLPGGRLVHLETIADQADTALYNVSSLRAVVVGDTLHLFTGSHRDSGMTHFTLSLEDMGVQRVGSARTAEVVRGTANNDILIAGSSGDTLEGGAGADVLVAGPGTTWMRGGAGADTFVMRGGGGTAHILDFERGVDRLDITDWPMLRDIGQLTITSTATGARIEYRGNVIVLTASNRQPLTADDLFPGGHLGPDRVPYIRADNTPPEIDEDDPPEPQPQPQPQPQPRPEPEPQPTPEPVPVEGRVIRGTPGDDTIEGGPGNDTIFGGQGNDLIRAGGGNNDIRGGAGNDTIIGGRGNDLLRGGAGADEINGGGGNDTILGGRGNDVLRGGAGDDLIRGGPGNDTIFGGQGNDLLYGSRGNNDIRGGAGRDTIFGGSGNDQLRGGGGADEIHGGAGNDTILGGPGNDLLSGGPGDDLIRGGPGNDTIIAGQGNDLLFGGAGADTFIFRRNDDHNRIMDFNPDEGDMITLNPALWQRLGNLTPQQILNRFATITDDGNIVLDFGPAANTIITLVGFDDIGVLSDHIQIL